MQDTLQKLRELFTDRLKLQTAPDDINEDTSIFGSGLGLDSIDVLELIVGIKKEFGVEIVDRELAEKVFTTVGSLVQYIEANR